MKKLLYILAFIEGGAVMCLELCSAKMLSPFFGTSIYVWASVLGVTLTALMSGYYFGGYLSSKNNKITILFWAMLLGGFLLTASPIISDFILPITINLNLAIGSIISLLSFMFAPLFLFGSISPLIINYLTNQAKYSGKSSGTTYAISTFGGIITTFVVGFYTLPKFGITLTLYGYGVLVLVYSAFLFVKNRSFKTPVSFILILGCLSYNFYEKKLTTIYQSDGILGEIKVIDRFHFDPETNQEKEYRELLVNNISQTIMDKKNPNKSYWDYVDILMEKINFYKNGDKTLLLGLGGGTLYKQLINSNLNVDVVEIDSRIEKIAKEYFEIDSDVKVVVDDARHYLNISDKKYDIIIYDLYHSETPPIHLMTQEAFNEIKEILNPNGLLIINFYGYINGEKGLGARSIYKTLDKCGYSINLLGTPGEESYRNLLFINSPNSVIKKNSDSLSINKNQLNLKNAFTLTDDKPLLEHIYLKAALDWRKNYNEFNTKQFIN